MAQSELQDERQMNHALQQNQSAWQSKFQALEKQFNECRIEKDKVEYHISVSIS
jgi:nitrate reductase assembly molybdenum cofactor insertion protein NarJ